VIFGKTSAVSKKFGSKVRQARMKIGISQEELAFQSGLDRTYISGIERGTRNPSLKNIEKIAKALKISPAELFSS